MTWLLGAALLLGLMVGPQWWARHVLTRHATDRPDLPGTGGELARHLLDRLGLADVRVERSTAGSHYDPQARVVRLEPRHLDGRSVTAVAVAAHEVGHAIQHRDGDPWLMRRQQLVPLALLLQRTAAAAPVAAPLLAGAGLGPAGVALPLALALLATAGAVTVHLVTLPVEHDASFGKALPILEGGGYLGDADLPAARQVLTACAWTYVAAALAAIIQALRWVRFVR